MGGAILSETVTEVLIPVASVVGIAYALLQWFLVSRVKLSPEQLPTSSNNSSKKNGLSEYLVEEEEGLSDHNVVSKCAEIQTAISEGLQFLFLHNHLHFSLSLSLFFSSLDIDRRALLFFFRMGVPRTPSISSFFCLLLLFLLATGGFSCFFPLLYSV